MIRRTVYDNLQELYKTHACRKFLEVFKILENECGYSPYNIPQLEDVSTFMKRKRQRLFHILLHMKIFALSGTVL